MRESKPTKYTDRNGRTICENDIVIADQRFGWIFVYDDEVLVAWDVEGPSCENNTSIDEILEDKYASIKVVGKLKD